MKTKKAKQTDSHLVISNNFKGLGKTKQSVNYKQIGMFLADVARQTIDTRQV